jgi:4-amino-4-deoxychorismate lyase
MSRWFLNGDEVERIHADDRAIQYGDGVFETIAIRGGRPRLWEYHGERLQTGCSRLGITAPDGGNLLEQLVAALSACDKGSGNATAKLIVSAGRGPRGYRRVGSSPATLIGVLENREVPASMYREGITVRLCNTRLAIQPQLAGMKTLNRLEQVLARSEWNDDSVFEGLTLDTDGRLICGTMSNVFLLNKNQLATPALTRCGVSGVMRRHVLTLAEEAGIRCEVRDVDVNELRDCDGLVLSNSQFGVLPVNACDQYVFDSVAASKQLMELVRDSGIPEVAV